MDLEVVLRELQFTAIRSSGSGGQHVNKVSSKVELLFNVTTSSGLSDLEKSRLIEKLNSRLTKDNILILQCGESRSQHKNKDLVVKRFTRLLKKGILIPKRRVATKIPKAVIRKRLDRKRKQAQRKANRKKPNLD